MAFLIGSNTLGECVIVKLTITGVVTATFSALILIEVLPGVLCAVGLYCCSVTIIDGACLLSGAIKLFAGLVLKSEVDGSIWG